MVVIMVVRPVVVAGANVYVDDFTIINRYAKVVFVV